VIRIYGCELEPYQLPIYILLHLFALEFCRERLVVDQLHFVSKSKKDSLFYLLIFHLFLLKTEQLLIDITNCFCLII
jgi:hypothetical protein